MAQDIGKNCASAGLVTAKRLALYPIKHAMDINLIRRRQMQNGAQNAVGVKHTFFQD